MNEITGNMIRQAAAGNQEAITQLYELTYSSVYKTVRAMVQDEDTVLDIVQDSYIKGFQSLEQLDAPENFRAWMKRIATNKAKDQLKKRKPILFSEMANEDGEEIDFRDECLDHCPEEVIDQQETARLMNEILGTLSEEQRLVIGMFYYEEMTVREIAEVLGCSENTVKSRLNYGRKKVEAKVRELEKKGTKLYSLAPLPFLLWLFRMDAQAAEAPSYAVWDTVTADRASSSGSAAGTSGTSAAGTGAKAAAAAGTKAAAKTGAKALAAKIIAGVLAVSVVGGGAAAVISNSHKQDEADASQPVLTFEAPSEVPSEAPVTEISPAVVSPEEAYSSVIANYQSVLGADDHAFLNAPENYFNGDHQAVFYYHAYLERQFYYAYQDIDGNGTEEMLVGFGSEDFIQIVDLYGFDGAQPVQLMNEPSLGDRSQLTLLEDGTLFFYSGPTAVEPEVREYWKVEGSSLISAAPSSAAEITHINWNILEVPESARGEESPSINAVEEVYHIIMERYRTACAVDHQAWMDDLDTYNALYDNLSTDSLMFYHMLGGQDSFFIAQYDLDRNGVNELFIGSGADTASAYPIGVYAFNGYSAVRICDGRVELLADGTIVFTGNGGEAERITQISPDGYSLVDVDTDIFYGEMVFEQDFASHGGRLALSWEYLCG